MKYAFYWTAFCLVVFFILVTIAYGNLLTDTERLVSVKIELSDTIEDFNIKEATLADVKDLASEKAALRSKLGLDLYICNEKDTICPINK